MKHFIDQLIQAALTRLNSEDKLPLAPVVIQVETTKDKAHGDFASNIALMLAKPAQKKPREIAELIVNALPASEYVAKVEIAGPGFINFFLSPKALFDIVPTILSQKENFGRCKIGREKTVLVEFVSSNPTGPLHVGHGRHAAYGSVVCNLLDAVGFKSYREYYVNDAGRQMDILAASVWLRYLAICGERFEFPANGYRGDYLIEIAKTFYDKHGKEFYFPAQTVFDHLPPDEPQGGDKEIYIDAIIERAKNLLGGKYNIVFDAGLISILDDISNDLSEFGVRFDNWFSERQFVATNQVDHAIQALKDKGYVFEEEGALWLRSTAFGDDKDRVLIRSNGQKTYFGNDAAYHINKFERGFDIVIDVFGSDHHGYVPRVRAAIQAVGVDPERLIHLLGQFVTLYRSGEQVQMSTRSGSFVTLRELRDEVGNDVARFFYVMRKYDQHIDFDLDLAKSQSNENPVYYVQYAHARICSVLRQLAERNLQYSESNGLDNLDLLSAPQERQLLNTLSRYPDTIINAALQYEPHVLTNYIRDLAGDFHTYYNASQFLVDEASLRDARLALVNATRQVLVNGFTLLGITAPETM